LQLAYDLSFSDLAYDSDVGNIASIQLIEFPNDGTKFYWHIKAGNSAGWSGYSNTWYFDNGTAPIIGDINDDCKVDGKDFAILAEQWLQSPGTPSADIAPLPGGDGTVNFLDVAAMVENWLAEN
jgi:hypothetical protein